MERSKSLKKEIIINAVAITLLSLLASLFSLGIKGGANISITYSLGKTFNINSALVFRAVLSAVCVFAAYYICLSLFNGEKSAKLPGKNLIFFIMLAAMGVAAFVVLALLLSVAVAAWASFYISAALALVYFLLIYKLFFADKINSNALFWEIFRFAIVGLIAAVCDFAVALFVQFFAFGTSTDWFVTAVSTASGFIVGVIINYILSTYMVYKAAKSGFSKTFKGVLAFVVLSAIGLFIGIGLQYLLYDYLFVLKGVAFLTYPIDFVIRTLVVMVYNYTSRKLLIYK